MPRIKNDLYQRRYMREDLCKMIRSKLALKGWHQKDLAKLLGITQARVSQKLRSGCFDLEELQLIFTKLDFTDSEIVRYLRV